MGSSRRCGDELRSSLGTIRHSFPMAGLFAVCVAGSIAMRITVSMPSTGVFYSPGLARPVVLDVDKLPAEVAQKLERLVEESKFFDQPEAIGEASAQGLRDAQQLTITVEAGGKQHTLRVSDPIGSIANASLREFVQLVREQAALERRKDKSD
jgi:hypothetical protein